MRCGRLWRPALVILATFAIATPFASAHDPSRSRDRHRYVAGAAGDAVAQCWHDYYWGTDHPDPDPGPLQEHYQTCLLHMCYLEEQHNGALPWHGLGGACFMFGVDVAPATHYSIRAVDNNVNPVAFYLAVMDSRGHLLSRGVACGEFPEGGGLVPIPKGGLRVWVFMAGATGPIDCLAFGEVGFPATEGTITLETA